MTLIPTYQTFFLSAKSNWLSASPVCASRELAMAFLLHTMEFWQLREAAEGTLTGYANHDRMVMYALVSPAMNSVYLSVDKLPQDSETGQLYLKPWGAR